MGKTCFEWYPSLAYELFQQGFHSCFQQAGNWFSQVGRSICQNELNF